SRRRDLARSVGVVVIATASDASRFQLGAIGAPVFVAVPRLAAARLNGLAPSRCRSAGVAPLQRTAGGSLENGAGPAVGVRFVAWSLHNTSCWRFCGLAKDRRTRERWTLAIIDNMNDAVSTECRRRRPWTCRSERLE